MPGETMVRVEDAPGNARRIFCAIDIPAPVSTVWAILTDYENLANVVPSLVSNEVIARTVSNEVSAAGASSSSGGVTLRQVGAAELIPGLKFKARCTLDVVEYPHGIPHHLLEGSTGSKSIEDADDLMIASTASIPLVRGVFPRPYAISHLPHRDLSMQSVETKKKGRGLRLGLGADASDFSIYQGVWRMQPLPGCADGDDDCDADGEVTASRLSYAVELSPSLPVPVSLLEGRIAADLESNLKAIRACAEQHVAAEKAAMAAA